MKIYLNKTKIFLQIAFSILVLGLMEPLGISGAAKYLGSVWVYIDYVSIICMYSSFLLGIYFAINNYKRKKQTEPFVIIYILFEITLLVSNVVNGTSLLTEIKLFLSGFALIEAFRFSIEKGKMDDAINTCIFYLELFVVINLVTIILYRGGLYYDDRGWGTNYFLGYRNLNIYTYLPLICFLGIKYRNVNRKHPIIILFLGIMAISIVLSGSSTSLAIIALILLGYLFFSNKEIPRFVKPNYTFIYSIVLSCMFVFFQFQHKISWLIDYLFQKNATFSQRSYIWKVALAKIVKHPIIGNGNSSFAWGSYYDATQCHNRFLDVLYMGGIILFLIFVVMVLFATHNNNSKGNLNLSAYALMGYAVLFLMEGRRTDYVFYLVLYIYWKINRREIKANEINLLM